MELKGIHHVSAITANAKNNYHFHTYILGMRLVKKNDQPERSIRNWQQTGQVLQPMKMSIVSVNHWHCRHYLKTGAKKLKPI